MQSVKAQLLTTAIVKQEIMNPIEKVNWPANSPSVFFIESSSLIILV